jgi:hypothetical protein
MLSSFEYDEKVLMNRKPLSRYFEGGDQGLSDVTVFGTLRDNTIISIRIVLTWPEILFLN